MTTQTPQYGFPVEVTSDAPGTTLREPGSLAQAVEDEIERIDAAIAAPQRSPDVFTSSDTWTNPDDGFRAVKVRMVGGGGAGGGAETVGAGEASVGSGGGAGEYAEAVIPAGSLNSTEAVTIGAGGTAVSGDTGGDGGTTSFGSHVSAAGGSGGLVRSAIATTSFVRGGTGGTGGTGGDHHSPGNAGLMGACSGDGNTVIAGAGGPSLLGGGANGQSSTSSSQDTPGNDIDTPGPGGGGSGARVRGTGNGPQPGGDGGDGMVIVEYIY